MADIVDPFDTSTPAPVMQASAPPPPAPPPAPSNLSIVDPFDAQQQQKAQGISITPIDDHGLAQREKLSPLGKALSPITSYPETYSEMNQEARNQISRGVGQLENPQGVGDVVKGVGNVGLGTAAYVSSPISAAYRSIIGQPVEDVTGIPREWTETAAELATPGIGLRSLTEPITPAIPPKPVDPFGVTQTLGESTGDLAARQFEQGALRGESGAPAQRHAIQFFNEQRPAQLAQAKENVAQSFDPLGQQNLAETPTEAANIVQQSLQREAAQSKASVKNLYDYAKSLPGEIDADVFRGMPQDIKTDLTNRPDSVVIDDNTPVASRMINYLNNQIGQLNIKNAASPLGNPPANQITGVDLEGIEQWRKNLSRMRGDALAAYGTNPSDARAAQAIVNEFDNRIAGAVNSGAFRGDPRAVQAFNSARSAHAARMQIWGNDPIGRKLQSIIGDYSRNKDPATLNDVANYIYGSSGSSSSANVGLVNRLRTVLGQDSPEWAAIKQGLFHRLVSTPEGMLEKGPGVIANQLHQFLNGKGSDLANALYTPSERELLQQYADLHRTLQVPQAGANWPNTAAGIIPHVKNVGKWISGSIGAVIGHHIMPGLGGEIGGFAAGTALPNKLKNASNLRRAAAQMPLIADRFKQWKQAIRTEAIKSSLANQARVSLAVSNLARALGSLGIDQGAALHMLSTGPSGPGPAQAQQRAAGGAVHSKDLAESVLPRDHQLGMRVPEGGSSCASCKFLTSPTTCGNKGFIKWNGTKTLPAPKDQYCCDLYEHTFRRAFGGKIKGYDDGGDVVPPDDSSTDPTFNDRFNAINIKPVTDVMPQTSSPDTGDADWQDKEAQANLASLGPPPESFTQRLTDVGKGILSAGEGLVSNTGQMLKGIAEFPQWAYQNPGELSKDVSKLTGAYGENRYQLWPERMIRSGFTLPEEVMSGKVPTYEIDPTTGNPVPSEEELSRTQDLAGMAGSGGIGGTGEELGEALGSAPFLRPALKYEGKIYKAPIGGEHMDAIPAALQPEFQRQALSGEDISNFNFGFMNHKGQFLNREQALDYAINEGLLSPHEARFGALTTPILRSESSDVGAPLSALEQQARTAFAEPVKAPEMPIAGPAPTTNLPAQFEPQTLSSDLQNFLKLSQAYESKLGPDWISKLSPQELTNLKSSSVAPSLTNIGAAKLAGVFDKILQTPINRRNLFSAAGTLATTVSNASKLMSLIDRIAPPAPAVPPIPVINQAEAALAKIGSVKDVFGKRSDALMSAYHRAEYALRDQMRNEQAAGVDAPTVKNKYQPKLEKLQSEMIQNHQALRDEAQSELAAQRSALNLPKLSNDQQAVLNYLVDEWPGLGGDFMDSRIRQNPYEITPKNEVYSDPGYAEWKEKKYQEQKKSGNFDKADIGYILHKMTPEQKAQIAEHLKPVLLQDENLSLRDMRTIAKAFPSLKGFALFSDTSASAPLAALEHEPFYSAVEKTIETAPQQKMQGVQWANWLKNQPGVKPDELQYTGIDNWLRQQKGPVTKQQVADYMANNKVNVNDVVKGTTGTTDFNDIDDSYLQEAQSEMAEKYPNEDWEDLETTSRHWDEIRNLAVKMYEEENPNEVISPTKYSSYQLPGGTNYQEHLLTLPRRAATPEEIASGRARTDENGNPVVGNVYRSHWDEPNVLAHVRSNERDVNGKPSLHLEELQSDLHQQGRKFGYVGDAERLAKKTRFT